MVEHTESCLKQGAEIEKLRQEYAAKWPKYCRKCEGWGGFSYSYDPSPAGVSLGPGSMQDWDPCPECTEKELCPRCGGPVPYDPDRPDKPCAACGYAGYEATPGMPPQHECYCWEKEIDGIVERARELASEDWLDLARQIRKDCTEEVRDA